MDDQPIPAKLKNAVIERGCQYLKTIEQALDGQEEREPPIEETPDGSRGKKRPFATWVRVFR